MNGRTFDELLMERFRKTEAVLTSKGQEYSTGKDKLHNFKRGAELLHVTPASCCMGFLTKHIVSVYDMVRKIEAGSLPTQEQVDEKIGDVINYFVLLEALILDARSSQ